MYEHSFQYMLSLVVIYVNYTINMSQLRKLLWMSWYVWEKERPELDIYVSSIIAGSIPLHVSY
jgi:hypothetical protein